jgi:hypothetical protein
MNGTRCAITPAMNASRAREAKELGARRCQATHLLDGLEGDRSSPVEAIAAAKNLPEAEAALAAIADPAT